MALQAQKQLLDELMGKNRNIAPGDKISSVRFDDDEVCRYFLCGFCPHDLFVNTKADLGPCDKIHDEELKKLYEKSSRFGKMGYEDEFEKYLRSLLLDVEKKIKRGNERLKLTQSENNGLTPKQIKEKRVAELKEEINSLIKKAESLGEEGKVEEAQQTLESCEKLKSECKYLEIQIETNQHAEQKQMEVCEVCGSFLIVNDAQARVEEHISGKQHMGYAKVKNTLEEIRKKRAKEYEDREKERNRDKRKRDDDKYSSRDRDRDRNRDRKRSRSRSRERHRDRDNRKSSSHRSRSRSRSKKRDYERSKHRSKSRSRSRDRSRDRKHKNDRHNRSSKSKEKLKQNDNSLTKINENSNGSSTNNNSTNNNNSNNTLDQEMNDENSV